MRFLRILLIVLLLIAAPFGAAQTATVTLDSVDLLTKPERSSERITSLKQGDAVFVSMVITAGGGNWCKVKSGNVSGYMLCRGLAITRSQGPDWSPVASTTAAPTNSATANNVLGRECESLNYRGWIARYKFSASQMAESEKVAGELGLSSCADRAEGLKQAYAEDPSVENKLRLDNQWAKLDPGGRCERYAHEFWKRVKPLMTAEQKTALDADLRRMARKLLTTQIDPSNCIPTFCIF